MPTQEKTQTKLNLLLTDLLSAMSGRFKWKQGINSIKYLCFLTIGILDSSKCSDGCCGFPRQDNLSPALQGGLSQGGDSMGSSFAEGTGMGERGTCKMNKGMALQQDNPYFFGYFFFFFGSMIVRPPANNDTVLIQSQE
jgi:hypothetical protein